MNRHFKFPSSISYHIIRKGTIFPSPFILQMIVCSATLHSFEVKKLAVGYLNLEQSTHRAQVFVVTLDLLRLVFIL